MDRYFELVEELKSTTFGSDRFNQLCIEIDLLKKCLIRNKKIENILDDIG